MTKTQIFNNIRTWAALLIAGAAFAACSGDDDSLTPTPSPNGEGNGQQVYTMTVQASKGGEGTRALTLTGSTLSATWAQGEEVTVYNVTTDEELTDKLTAQGSGSSTTLKGSLSSTKGIHNGDQLMLKFCSDTYSGQDGTLEYIAANCDYAEAEVTVSTISNGNITISESHADFQNQQAIVKFTLKQSDGSALPSNPTALTVDYGTGAVSLTGIPADTYSNENNGNGVLYVAIPGLDSKYLNLKATVGSSTYIYSKPDVTFANSQYYTIGVKMRVCNVTGRVIDNSSNPLAGVVVSDGAQCVKTLSDGTFYMASDIAIDHTKFVYVSTPSGYLPAVSGGIPHFYKLTEDITPSNDIYDFGDYTLTPVANPDRFTVLMTADLQPRKNNTFDRIAYKSLDVCQDLYQELKDVASGISGRQVYGICLGDIVHEDIDLYPNYVSPLGTLGYPTYNVIGNHDYYPDVDSDDYGAETFESYFGPRNYSFNIGGIHFVVLDNLMMKDNGEGYLTAYDEGLSDAVWTWLQADLALVPTTTKLMVCSHAPMFKLEGGGDASSSAAHGSDYAALLDSYDEVHVWAGHTHSSFNYIYPGGSHKNIQVHTLARSTGELYTNEYLSNGTPRGFTVVDVEDGNITWKFHPMTRQRGAFQGVSTGYCSAGAPAYTWRDWNYSSYVAVMKDGSGSLTESYQMHAYPRGSYGDNYVYVNIFLWDENWGTPVWTPDGGDPVAMTRINTADNHNIVDVSYVYDKADKEIRNWYKTYANKSGGSLVTKDDYTIVPTDKITTLFRTSTTVAATPASGIVSVTDRFGNVYSRSVSW